MTRLKKIAATNNPAVVWVGAPDTYVSGYAAEHARGLGHVEVAFVSTINFAEIAWPQGIDLYSTEAKRLTAYGKRVCVALG